MYGKRAQPRRVLIYHNQATARKVIRGVSYYETLTHIIKNDAEMIDDPNDGKNKNPKF